MTHPLFQRFALSLILCTSWAASFAAKASTIKWDGGGGTAAWELPTNWDGDVLPTGLDLAAIGTSSVQLSSSQTIAGFTSSTTALFTVGNGASLTVGTGGIVNEGSIQLSANGSSVFADLFANG